MILFRQKVAIPDFLDSQRKSFRLFLETGIRHELEFVSPIIGDSLGSNSQQPEITIFQFHSYRMIFILKNLLIRLQKPSNKWKRIVVL